MDVCNVFINCCFLGESIIKNRVCIFPLQQKGNTELRERLSVVEKTQSIEIEGQSREIENLRRSEQKFRAKAETLPSLLEQLSFLQHELENTGREKEDLEEQTKVYKEQTQQVGLPHTSIHTSKCIILHRLSASMVINPVNIFFPSFTFR